MFWHWLCVLALLLGGGQRSLRSDLFYSHSSTPSQVHVSLAGPNGARVTWTTIDPSAPSLVEFGTTSGIYDRIAYGDSDSYKLLFYRSGQIHNVVLRNLSSSTLYFYKCGGEGLEYAFRTPPAIDPETSITFAMAGDLGQTDDTRLTLNHIQHSNYDVFLLPGDLSYADYYQPLWDSFGTLIEPLASSRPVMVTQGNHEKENLPLLLDPFRSYNTRWRMPYEESGSDSNLYYSFEVAGVHVLMLGSYTDVSRDSSQYKWLQADLAKVDRNRTPWLIALLHAPWYNSNSKHQGDGEHMRKSMEFLLHEAKVDVLIAGHVHAYERTSKVFNGRPDSSGIVHITVGVGGNREGLACRFLSPIPEWSLYREASYGHGILKMVNATHAHWSWHRNQDDELCSKDKLWLLEYYCDLSMPILKSFSSLPSHCQS
ncbi:hypothetical protein GOP47_0024335 [Adiantum capillus-veneris]|uniref:Purple acid phosphatase n=1 Tax=Adiantum capillus-veneris TaxID=13818 RepID=A0A9D4U1Y5_ADICA|nr:hypothetical protein GOP47_0024335 [Adiantum capillus-veneris]